MGINNLQKKIKSKMKRMLEYDAEILSNRFQKINNNKINKENRRKTMCFNNLNYSETSKENRNPNRRLSNIYIPSNIKNAGNIAFQDLNDENITSQENERSENSKI